MPSPLTAPDLLRLSSATRAALREIGELHRRLGRWPDRLTARAIARRHHAPAADVAVLAGHGDRRATPAARRLGRFLHGER
jgi:hypothetical protein